MQTGSLAKLLGLALLMGLGVLIALGSILFYLDSELPVPEPSEVRWTRYTNQEVGFWLELPSVYLPDVSPDGHSVLFRFRGTPLVHVTWTDEASARQRGLWARHDPVARIELGGRPGKQYIYNHFDGPLGMRTYAYVVPHRERFLALEFRTRRTSLLEEFGLKRSPETEPDQLCQRILGSFHLQ